MTWNWQQEDWPHFTYDPEQLKPLEETFLYSSGILFGAFKHVDEEKKQSLNCYYRHAPRDGNERFAEPGQKRRPYPHGNPEKRSLPP